MRRPYDAPAWRRTRQAVLERDNYTCRIQLPGCTKVATAVDHIVPWLSGGKWLDPLNLRAACTRCNTARSNGVESDEPTPLPPSRDW